MSNLSDGVEKLSSKKDLLVNSKRPASYNLTTTNSDGLRKERDSDTKNASSPTNAELRQAYKPYIDEINKLTSKEEAFKSV
jgi:hypothetical protein